MILTFDIGTTVLKGGLFSRDGQLLFKETAPMRLLKSDDPLFHESDPAGWEQALKEIIFRFKESALKDCSENKLCLDAIVISGNGPTLVPVSLEGKALGKALSWMDRRGVEEARFIEEQSDTYIDPTFYLPKALWIKRHRPEIYEKTGMFLSCPEYLVFLLTGRGVTILPGSHFTKWFWTEDLLEKIGLEKEKFPPFVKPGDIVGQIIPEMAELLDLESVAPVIAGGPDFIMSLLGTGAVYPGRACDRAGTSEGINLCCEALIRDDRLMSYGHVVEPYFNLSGIISTSGKALEWVRTLCSDQNTSFESLLELAGQTAPGAKKLLFLPYLTGERAPLWDPLAKGAFIGLSLNHGKGEMIKAVLESTGFAMRHVIEVIEEHGVKVTELRVTGTPARSELWNQIKADISGRCILLPDEPESELQGDLCIALYGLGDYSNLAEAADKIVRIRKTYEPRQEYKELYDKLFNEYKESYKGLRDIFHRLSQ
jgi:xylulokinase